jgi:hypothetical protein
MIYHGPKIGFVHQPRTSGTSVEHALNQKYPQAIQMFGNKWYDGAVISIKSVHTRRLPNETLEYHKKHATYAELIDYAPDYKYYATVRHPKTKLESLYRLVSWSTTDGVPWVNVDFNTWVDQFLIGGLCMPEQDILDTRNFGLTQSEFIGSAEWYKMEVGGIWRALDIEKPLHRYRLSDLEIDIEWNHRSELLCREYYAEDYHRFKYE